MRTYQLVPGRIEGRRVINGRMILATFSSEFNDMDSVPWMASGLFFDKFVDVVLCSVVAGWDLKDVGGAKERLTSVAVSYHLKSKRTCIIKDAFYS